MKKNAENADEFICKGCDFKCCKLSEWSRHILTRKHQNRTNLNEKTPKSAAACFKCKKCNKEYKARNSLWYHENKCDTKSLTVEKINENLLTLICEQTKTMEKIANQNAELQKQNTELVSKTLELCKQTSTTINHTNNNQRFNINLFLNEECKDAINFADFIKNIEITHQDLENNAQLGFVNGISKIFLDNLKQLGVNERPFHCTDTKRETMYIKDEDKWTKESDDSKLQKAIQTVSYKSMGKLQEWKQENPDYQDVDSEFSKKCMDIHKQSIAGSDREVYYPKVIHVLAKETMVDK